VLAEAGLEVERVEFFEKVHKLDDWLARTGCEGDEAARVTELLAPQLLDDGSAWQDTKILLKGRKSQS
jgi:hypothetical protein